MESDKEKRVEVRKMSTAPLSLVMTATITRSEKRHIEDIYPLYSSDIRSSDNQSSKRPCNTRSAHMILPGNGIELANAEHEIAVGLPEQSLKINTHEHPEDVLYYGGISWSLSDVVIRETSPEAEDGPKTSRSLSIGESDTELLLLHDQEEQDITETDGGVDLRPADVTSPLLDLVSSQDEPNDWSHYIKDNNLLEVLEKISSKMQPVQKHILTSLKQAEGAKKSNIIFAYNGGKDRGHIGTYAGIVQHLLRSNIADRFAEYREFVSSYVCYPSAVVIHQSSESAKWCWIDFKRSFECLFEPHLHGRLSTMRIRYPKHVKNLSTDPYKKPLVIFTTPEALQECVQREHISVELCRFIFFVNTKAMYREGAFKKHLDFLFKPTRVVLPTFIASGLGGAGSRAELEVFLTRAIAGIGKGDATELLDVVGPFDHDEDKKEMAENQKKAKLLSMYF